MSRETPFESPTLWHGLAIRGVVLLSAAAVALAWPVSTLALLVAAAAVGALALGAVDVGQALLMRRALKGWWLLLARGIAAVLLAVAIFLYPLVHLHWTLAICGAWLVVQGVLLVELALDLRHEHGHDGILWSGAIASLALAATALVWSTATLLSVFVVLAIYAAVAGLLELSAGLRLRALVYRSHLHVAPRAAA